MDRTNLFLVNGHRIIINEEHSSIGYGYPRIFIEVSEDKHINFDVTLGYAFRQKKTEFESWLDGEEINHMDDMNAMREVCERCGLKYDNTLEFIKEMIKG